MGADRHRDPGYYHRLDAARLARDDRRGPPRLAWRTRTFWVFRVADHGFLDAPGRQKGAGASFEQYDGDYLGGTAMIDLARQGWRWMIVQGALTLLIGIAISIWPDSTMLLLLILL